MIILQATNRDKWPLEQEEVIQSHPRPNAATLLDHEQAYWMKFVVDGQLDGEKMAAENYTGAQVPWIQSEMIKLGWLPS